MSDSPSFPPSSSQSRRCNCQLATGVKHEQGCRAIYEYLIIKTLYLHSHSARAPADLPAAHLSLVRPDGATHGLNHELTHQRRGFHHAGQPPQLKQRIPAALQDPRGACRARKQKQKKESKNEPLLSWNRQPVICGLCAACFSQ